MRGVTFSTGHRLLDDICITMTIRKACGNPTRNTGCCISRSRGNTRNRETMASDNQEAVKTWRHYCNEGSTFAASSQGNTSVIHVAAPT